MFLGGFLHVKRFLVISLTLVKALRSGRTQDLKYARIHFGNARLLRALPTTNNTDLSAANSLSSMVTRVPPSKSQLFPFPRTWARSW